LKYEISIARKKLWILSLIATTFKKGSKDNKWNEIINDFVEQINQNTVEDTVEILECNFNSSTVEEKIACRVAIMDICKEYFKYSLCGGCGFPSITLDGTKEEWILLYKKTQELLNKKVSKKFGLKWRLTLLPILLKFVDCYDGVIDCLFWNTALRRAGSMSGNTVEKNTEVYNWRDWYSGWVNIFFPYVFSENGEMKENYCCTPYSIDQDYVKRIVGHGPNFRSLPIGLSSAPVELLDLSTNKKYNLKFASGFLGVTQDEKTLAICAQVGWFIAEN